ncbi:carboxymuconolactone decarboxylase family protein [Kribbella sp. NBC_00889]|uniref:carboxymuconolactone decarboxylase family protein n=1 Tax=Kribbella sp. NBC_00889 TaxID=2975974 RepID=UPI0038705E4A|nr:carboxymuconolactone decarboxylase family protein [Kribbella sp. NBC_00889]
MDLTVHTTSTAPAESKALLEGIAEDLGFVPNLAATTATSSTLLAAFDGLRRAVTGGALDPVLRETAGLAVGVAVDNRYGVAFHSTVLAALGATAADLERMRAGDEPADSAAAAVYALARELVLTRGKVAEGTVRRTAEAGLSEADVLEVVAECTFAGLVGTLDNLAGRVELDEPLRPATWSAP